MSNTQQNADVTLRQIIGSERRPDRQFPPQRIPGNSPKPRQEEMLNGRYFRDPIDHEQTSRPRVRQALKSPAKFPGLLFITVGLLAFAVGLASFAHHQTNAGIAATLVALTATGAGVVWLWREAQRVRALERRSNTGLRGPLPRQ